MKFTTINSKQFQAEVIESEQPVLVEVSYQYCSACQDVKEFIVNHLQKEIKLVELDIANNQELAAQYGVDKTPTLLLFNQGTVVASHIGYIDQQELSQLLAQLSWWGKIKNKLKLIFTGEE